MTTSPHETSQCPFCGSDKVTVRNDDVETVRIGRKKTVVEGLQSSICLTCANTFVSPTQHDANVDAIRSARLKLTPISPKDVRLVRAKLGISQYDAQQMFAGGKNAFSKYERGEVAPSLASARLMTAAVSIAGVAKYLAEQAGVKVRQDWEKIGARGNVPRDTPMTGGYVAVAPLADLVGLSAFQKAISEFARISNIVQRSSYKDAEAALLSVCKPATYDFVVNVGTTPLTPVTLAIADEADEYIVATNTYDDTPQLVSAGAQRRAMLGVRGRKSRSRE